ncbi:MAG: Yip1 family protein, partial [Anaerolineales bacterium]
MSTNNGTPFMSQGIVKIILGMILRPKDTHSYLLAQGGHKWLYMAALATLMVIILAVISGPIIASFFEEIFMPTYVTLDDRFEITPEIQAQMEQVLTHPIITIGFPAVFTVTMIWVGWLIWTVALHLVGMWLGGKHRFGQIWQVVVWSQLPIIFSGFLASIYILITGEFIFNLSLARLFGIEPAFPDPSFVQPSVGQMVMHALLARIELFQVWSLILIGIGMMVAAKLSLRKAILVILLVWGTFTLISILMVVISTII